ncbi:phosphotransferase [Kribbella sp. NPDC051936]|uniref:phosphotransferase n=1 Tax=Kribbella sp. NPDC051936 TaxID=3154946 RepID=UPI00342F3762
MDSLLRHWGLQGYDVRPLTEGTNNTGFYVGDEYVLRIHRNAIDPVYEHAVLRSLGRLSFAVPVPAPTNGETAIRGELDGRPILASLSRRIPGERNLTVVHFQRGYLDAFPLTDAELSAVPELELPREATSLVHWYGRYLEGQTTAAGMAERGERLLRVSAGQPVEGRALGSRPSSS